MVTRSFLACTPHSFAACIKKDLIVCVCMAGEEFPREWYGCTPGDLGPPELCLAALYSTN